MSDVAVVAICGGASAIAWVVLVLWIRSICRRIHYDIREASRRATALRDGEPLIEYGDEGPA